MRQSAWVQISALRVDTDLENLMGVDQRGVDGSWSFSKQADYRAAGR
ncbi:MAG: hypothetical protein QOE94_2974 [Mycobacterium sp.]|jgi:hypothetical protein|nr:hypothetical protein [Mycobacterium sp.]